MLKHCFRELIGAKHPKRVYELDEVARLDARKMLGDVRVRYPLVGISRAEVLNIVRNEYASALPLLNHLPVKLQNESIGKVVSAVVEWRFLLKSAA
jgi:hypothetical protein